jgi:predicted acylesterase/phospholipase RssA
VTPDELAGLPRPLAFVLPGGGALGSYQVGVMRALTEAGVAPDMLIGVSAGSVNASLFAWNHGLDGLQRVEAIWRSIRRRDLLRFQPHRLALAMAGRYPSFLDNRHGREFLRRHFGGRHHLHRLCIRRVHVFIAQHGKIRNHALVDEHARSHVLVLALGLEADEVVAKKKK